MAEATADPDITPIITIDILVQAGRYPIDLKQRHLENAFVCPCIFLLFFSIIIAIISITVTIVIIIITTIVTIIVIIRKSSSSSSSSSGHPHYRHHFIVTIISSLVSQRQVAAHASPQSLCIARTAAQSSAPGSTKHSTEEALFISSS